jgi:hypothetical protein
MGRGGAPPSSAAADCIVSTASSAANLYLPVRPTIESARSRTHTIVCAILFLKRSLICPLISLVPASFGSCTKDCPADAPGGSAPVVAYFRHSMIVVLPQPFAPTMTLRV